MHGEVREEGREGGRAVWREGGREADDAEGLGWRGGRQQRGSRRLDASHVKVNDLKVGDVRAVTCSDMQFKSCMEIGYGKVEN